MPEANRPPVFDFAILDSDKFSNHKIKGEYKADWNPQELEVHQALLSVRSFLHNLEQNPSSQELAHPAYAANLSGLIDRLPKTLCQAIGIEYEMQHAVFLNFIPSSERWSNDWTNRYIHVFDGGPRFWTIVYLPNSGEFKNLRIDLGF